MRLRAVYLIAAAVSVVAVLMVAGPAYATSNWSCGEDFATSPAPLDNNLDCSGYGDDALVVTGNNVTLDLGGHTVTGTSDYDVVDSNGYTNTTVQNGTLAVGAGGTATVGVGVNLGISVWNTATIANVTIEGGAYGVDAYYIDALTVEGSTISGSTDYGVYASGNNVTIEDSTIAPATGGAEAIKATHGLGDMISGNTITGNFDGSDAIDGEIGIHLYKDTGALVQDNTVSSMGEWGFYESWSSGTRLSDNTFDSNYYGVEFYGGIGPNSSNVISGNFIKNSYYEGVYDLQSDLNSYVGNVATNNGIECGTNPTQECAAFFINPADYGSVTMTNNYSRLSSWGFLVENAYDSDAFASTRTTISGNSATYDDFGFGDSNSLLATWTDNTAYGNNDFGYYFEEPTHETISNNSAFHNGGEGFFFGDNAPPHNPLAVTNNVAEYNGDYGFDASSPLGASSGNTGNNTNGTDDCWYVAGCS
ncbi:MAG TPA: right-handed parallel beta-helix repeat-containing protein [Gaiellaceae bacterium]|nr:right-handed parallel beta-helix repeat-containing protein [Gaiellaceae bacterium]